jgi:hypothetical protein
LDLNCLANIFIVKNTLKKMAQAYTLCKNGERWWFDEAEIARINERNKNFSICGHEEELLMIVVAQCVVWRDVKRHWFVADILQLMEILFSMVNLVEETILIRL